MPSADGMKHGLAAQGGLAPSPAGSKSMKSLPQFLAICWEETGQDGLTVTLPGITGNSPDSITETPHPEPVRK